MDSSQQVQDHIPDENYIERLFPKCPPKQSVLRGSKNPPRSDLSQRKQNKSKVHQHSRRDLETRRSKNKNSVKQCAAISSESSDDNCKRRIVNKINSRSQYAKSSHSGPRKSGKYQASQSLLQQLQRSQSNYSNSNTTSAEQQNNNPRKEALKDSSSSNQANATSGIIKSTSSHSFVNETSAKYYKISSPLLPKVGGSYDNSTEISKPIVEAVNHDNFHSDLFNNIEYGSNSEIRSILRKRETTTIASGPSHYDTSDIADTSRTLIPGLDKESDSFKNNLVGKIEARNNRHRLFDANDSIGIENEICGVSTSSPPSLTADLSFREKIQSNNKELAKNDLLTNTTRMSNDNSKVTGVSLEDHFIEKHNETNNPTKKDDNMHINLFVHDNASDNLQKINPPADQDNNLYENQSMNYHSRGDRYQQRLKRIPNRAHANKSRSVSFESLKNSIEIGEIIEEEDIVSPAAVRESISPFSLEPLKSGDVAKLSQDSKQNFEENPNIISVHHQASQQLLAPDSNDNDVDILRNDASTEELCNIEDIPNEISNDNKHRLESDISLIERVHTGQPSELDKEVYLKTQSPTVDEKAEFVDNFEFQDQLKSEDKQESEPTVDMMPPNQPTLTKKSFVPPGFPKRINLLPDTQSGGIMAAARDNKPPANNLLLSRLVDTEPDERIIQDVPQNGKIIKQETAQQRVKFDEESLVKVKDNYVRSNVSQKPHSSVSTMHPPQMPIIKESDLELIKNIDETSELAASLNKISFANFTLDSDITRVDSAHRQSSSTESSQQFQVSRNRGLIASELETQPIGEPPQTSNIDSITIGVESSATNMQHHKPLNESSHHSIVRANRGSMSISNNDSILPSRSSSMQFNSLSENESGPDELDRLSQNRNYSMSKKCDLTSSINRSGGSFNVKNTDDDLVPTSKTALMFPRLDEGLSSEAESGDDEVEDDDEKAMDADVDADDDDEEEDDDDDDDDVIGDAENGISSHDRSSIGFSHGHPNVENFMRQQQHSKPQNRSVGSLQQQHGLNPLVGNQSGIQQNKGSGSANGSFVNQDSLDQADIKSIPNYANQNGQSNFWGPSHPSNLPPAQSTSSQHFSQRSQNNILPVKPGNNFSRDETKASRLSSDTDNETDRLLGSQRSETQSKHLVINDVDGSNNSPDIQQNPSNVMKQNSSSREVLIEGVLFNVKYLGSTHSDCEGRSEKEDRIHQAEMAVHEVKFRNGESQSATEVQLFISTEKIMVLDDKHRKIMMDHSLRTISYIADIGDAIVLIVRKKSNSSEASNELVRPISKISCHVFESSESHTITKSISQAFQVAYTELLKANGAGDISSYLPKELDYQEVLNSQEMSTDELEMFARKENQREVIVPKEKGEILGLSIVESGWGSVLPTVVIANLKHDGPAYRCKRLSIGDQILSVNGISLVGLPLAECQEILRKTKNQRVAKLSVVPCPITVEVKIKRPDTKYQLGFSVQNGVICSLLRGGIAERGGVRVGHRIMSINGTTVVGVPHEKIVTLLASSVGEIRMKTCLTSLYRLILGEENPVHF